MFIKYSVIAAAILVHQIACISVTRSDDAGQDSESDSIQSQESDGADQTSGGLIPVEQSIAKFEQRVKTRPTDFLSLTILGQLYLRQAREQDDLPYYAKAEETFRAALQIKPDHRSAMTFLAITLEARHQFAEALELASQVAETSERETLALATVGDCQLHLGRYDEAEVTYNKLAERAKSPAVIARQAHLSELRGNPEQATKLVMEALALCNTLGTTRQDVAWYEMRLGNLLLNQGKLADAEEHFRVALHWSKDYAAAQLGLAEVIALQGRLDEAEKQYLETIDQHGEPPAMAGLGDVLMKKGDHDAAKEWYAKAEAVMVEEALSAAAAHYREVAMFYANHDLNPKRALELAEMDLKQRQDIYAYDALAWALYRNQQFEKAQDAIQLALRLTTRDANMHFHAGMISLALGDTEKARQSLTAATEINPKFSVLYSDVAAAELKKLE